MGFRGKLQGVFNAIAGLIAVAIIVVISWGKLYLIVSLFGWN